MDIITTHPIVNLLSRSKIDLNDGHFQLLIGIGQLAIGEEVFMPMKRLLGQIFFGVDVFYELEGKEEG